MKLGKQDMNLKIGANPYNRVETGAVIHFNIKEAWANSGQNKKQILKK